MQTGLSVWLTNRMWGRASRTPTQLAELVAQDLSTQLAQAPQTDIDRHLRDKYGSGYQPFVVVLGGDPRTLSNRPTAIPGTLGRDARIRLSGRGPDRGGGGLDRGRRRARSGRWRARSRAAAPDVAAADGSLALVDVLVNGTRAGVVAVPLGPPPLSVGLRELAPVLISVGIALLAVGAAIMSLVIFRPTHLRLRSLEDAARALGEGRTDVRANESGGDEVSALSTTFNTMAADLQARATALADSDRARRQLLADVSHELMTPLSAIRGYVETLGMPELTLDEDTRRRYLDIADQETHKLEAIIGDLLDLARLEGGGDTLEPEEVFADDLFRRVADRHRPVLCERKITLTSTTAPGTPHIWGDADRLEQALQNLAANAIRHTPDGGRSRSSPSRPAIACASPSPIRARAFHPSTCPTSSIGSTRRTPRARARACPRAAGSGCRSSARSSSATAATSTRRTRPAAGRSSPWSCRPPIAQAARRRALPDTTGPGAAGAPGISARA